MRVQATVASFDPATSTGRVLLDDGVALVLPHGALRPSAARLLRRGQRVVLEIDDSGSRPVVISVHLLTVPPPGPPPGPAASAASTTDDPPRRQ